MSSAPPLAGHVHLLGERGDVPQLLRELTLLLHAARQEPLGRVLLEAAACGNAIVATTAGGTAEIFPHPSQARLVPVDDVDRLASETLRLLEDESSRRALGQAARTRAEQAFNVRHAAAQLAVHYRDAAARRAL
jgi:glycosyltransferase involved in cell wall biosynthesis